MSVAYQIDRIGAVPAAGAGGRTGFFRLVAEAVSAMFFRVPQDEQRAEQRGFEAPRAQACPYQDERLRRAFRRGREQRLEWEESAW